MKTSTFISSEKDPTRVETSFRMLGIALIVLSGRRTLSPLNDPKLNPVLSIFPMNIINSINLIAVNKK